MKKLSIILSSFCFIAISCNNSSGSDNKTTGQTETALTNPTTNYGTITCNMDGTPKTFHVSQSFFEISLDVYRTDVKDGIEVLNGDTKHEGFQFEIKKSGTTKIKDNATGDMNCIVNYYNPRGVTYTGEDVTFTVTTYDQQHLTGTFSGKLVNVYYDEGTNGAKNYPQYIQITDGKFDVHH
ncbi:MAG: hypothetical protein JST17_15430 [Bacteroidetes bacterium]|nr:hypothetical protein [Bacteroidota bacterium]MBS1930576.1 hypothetical protein [Bacteroidota bacterium]